MTRTKTYEEDLADRLHRADMRQQEAGRQGKWLDQAAALMDRALLYRECRRHYEETGREWVGFMYAEQSDRGDAAELRLRAQQSR